MAERRLEKLAVGVHCAAICCAGAREKNVFSQAGQKIQSGAARPRFDSEGEREECSTHCVSVP